MVILAATAMAFAASQNPGQINTTNSYMNQSISQQNQENSSDSCTFTLNTHNKKKISPHKAQKIAQKYIEEPEANLGTPILNKTDCNNVYIVPVTIDGKNVGEIDIDAQTGENLGGAGGAPST